LIIKRNSRIHFRKRSLATNS